MIICVLPFLISLVFVPTQKGNFWSHWFALLLIFAHMFIISLCLQTLSLVCTSSLCRQRQRSMILTFLIFSWASMAIKFSLNTALSFSHEIWYAVFLLLSWFYFWFFWPMEYVELYYLVSKFGDLSRILLVIDF